MRKNKEEEFEEMKAVAERAGTFRDRSADAAASEPAAAPVTATAPASAPPVTAATPAPAPAVPDPYGDAYRRALEDYAAPAPFTWDAESDPAYQAYRKAYAREGRRAGEDTLGQYAAMTGGVPSTAAVTAAQQASDYYASRLADRVPELYRLAYSMYADADARRLRTLEALRDARADELARWDAAQSYADSQRDFDYKVSRDERGDALALAKLAAANGDYARLAGLGVDVTRANGTRWAYGADGSVYEIGSAKGLAFLDGAQPGQTMTGGDGSAWTKQPDGSITIARGGQTWVVAAPEAPAPTAVYRGGGTAKPDLTAAQVNAALAAGVRTDKVLSAYEYYYGAPYEDPEAEKAAGKASAGKAAAPSLPAFFGDRLRSRFG